MDTGEGCGGIHVRINNHGRDLCEMGSSVPGEVGTRIACNDKGGIAFLPPQDIYCGCLTRVVECNTPGKIDSEGLPGHPREYFIGTINVPVPSHR
jgi:hypothetical protein